MKAWLRVIICFGLAFFLLELLITGEISLYINPRLKWLVALSVLMLVILGVVQLWNLRQRELHRIGVWGYVMSIIPMVFLLLVAPKVLDASSVQKRGVQLKPNPTIEVVQKSENPYQKLVKELGQKNVISFEEKTYLDIINTINMYPEKLKGKKIKIYGFVYRDQTIKKNEFILGRFMVTCCTADSAVAGFLVKSEKAGSFKNDQWLEIVGTLDTEPYDGEEIPVIRLEKSKRIEPLKDPYIYVTY